MGNHSLQLVTGKVRVDVNILGQAFNVESSLGVGAQNLLEFFDSSAQTNHSLLVVGQVCLVFLFNLFQEMFNKNVVVDTATKLGVKGNTLDHGFFLGETSNGNSQSGFSNVNKADVARLFFGQVIHTSNSVQQSGGSRFVL
eukprot:Lithocolla_globosa_v1_NODE_1043_length_2920_cov_340.169284.p2 type:complete len:141 gc:universal NODE_1043_length_2920_cov_340.169284:1748-2170(+)